MTGMEAWSIVAPILAAHGGTNKNRLDCIDEAYVTVYAALKQMDEKTALKEVRQEVDEINIPDNIKSVDGSFAFCEALEYVGNILDKKIAELEDKK